MLYKHVQIPFNVHINIQQYYFHLNIMQKLFITESVFEIRKTYELDLLSLNWPLQNNATLTFSAHILYSVIYCFCCGLRGYTMPSFDI